METRAEYVTEDHQATIKPGEGFEMGHHRNRFFPENQKAEGYISPNPSITLKRFTISGGKFGDMPAAGTALVDNWGTILSWQEIQEIVAKVEPFYRTVPQSVIEVHNIQAQTRFSYLDLGSTVPPRPKDNGHPGFVYLLQAGPYYKIGASIQVDERIKQLATLPPFDIDLLHTFYTGNMYTLEKNLHDRFADKRKNGEWFELAPEDVEYIKGL